MAVPNFFIVGAPKCGTTSMDSYLKQHPEIYIPRQKELHHFGEDLDFRIPRVDREKYLSYFAGAVNEKILGESSVWYMFSRSAAEEIHRFNPESKILIMLRNPIDVLYSLHSQLLYSGDEDITDFEQALAAEEARRRGEDLPKKANVRFGIYYREIVQFSDQIKRYTDRFGRERVCITLFDDLKADPRGVYLSVLEFLDVDPGFIPEFTVVNPNKRIRFALLNRLLQETVVYFKRIGAFKALGFAKVGAYDTLKRLKRWNTAFQPRKPLDERVRRTLNDEFRGEVERLSMLLERDLSGWLT